MIPDRNLAQLGRYRPRMPGVSTTDLTLEGVALERRGWLSRLLG